MAEKSAVREVHPELVAQIVRSYVEHHSVGVGELSDLISTVHRSLSRLGESQPAPEKVLVPVVPIKRSVQRDYVVCLDCGFRGKMLRRHIRNVHGLETADYRARWKLSADHPLTAPSYSERRSVMAKHLGLGRRRAAVVSAASAPDVVASPKRRSRKPPEEVASIPASHRRPRRTAAASGV